MTKELSLIKTFVEIDDKCKRNEEKVRKNRGRVRELFDSELVTIFLIYKRIGYKTFREFYDRESNFLRNYFPKMPNYKGLMKLKESANVLFANKLMFASKQTQKSENRFYIDSTPLPVCKIIRSYSHATFRNIASYGYSSTGQFYGFKLHLVIDERKKWSILMFQPGPFMISVFCNRSQTAYMARLLAIKAIFLLHKRIPSNREG